MSDEDFRDADGDGVARFHVYMYGPGDPVAFPMSVGLEKRDGRWQGRGTVDWTFSQPE